eukprot:scaffold105704_cov45-Phaeocystis_antarctica.AAC.1
MYSASGVCSAASASSETIYEGGAGADGGGTGDLLHRAEHEGAWGRNAAHGGRVVVGGRHQPRRGYEGLVQLQVGNRLEAADQSFDQIEAREEDAGPAKGQAGGWVDAADAEVDKRHHGVRAIVARVAGVAVARLLYAHAVEGAVVRTGRQLARLLREHAWLWLVRLDQPRPAVLVLRCMHSEEREGEGEEDSTR